MKVTVKKLTDYTLMNLAMNFTSNKEVVLTAETIKWMYDAEHSPIRTQIWSIELYDIPTYVSTHLVRHNVGMSHFVKSNRKTDEIITRDSLVNHLIMCNAQSLINVSKERLCSKADTVTTTIWESVVSKIREVDTLLVYFLVPKCERLGRCPEKYSCGRK